jgi:mRNA interferase RelE/StbE
LQNYESHSFNNMELIVRTSFKRDIKKLDKEIKAQIEEFFQEVDKATKVEDLIDVKKIHGYKQINPYRKKIGDYRLGFFVESDNIIEVVIFQKRKDIYKKFP